MKMNLVKTMSFVALFAGLAMTPSAANASLALFTWTPDTTRPFPVNILSSSGTLEYNTVSGDITDFSFSIEYFGTDNRYDAFSGSYVLVDGDLALTGFSYDNDAFLGIPDVFWSPTGSPQPDEEVGDGLFGDWVPTVQTAPIPEPTTVFAGAILLLPLGVGAARSLRKNRNA